MSDPLLTALAHWATELDFDSVPPPVADVAAAHLVDTLGCLIAGFACPPARLIEGALPGSVEPGLTVGRPAARHAAEDAALLNTVRLRYLEYNDQFPGGHPSDSIGALLAHGAGVSGPRLIAATVAAYEVHHRLCQLARLRESGWDQGFNIAVATAVGLCNLARVPVETATHAIAIAAVSGLPLRATRAGNLSMWKGCATAFANKVATAAVRLASAGVTGPERPFTGTHGLFEQATGPFDLPGLGTDYWLPRTNLKFWPVEYHLQNAVWAGLAMREHVAPEDVARVEVTTYRNAWHETASDPSKWSPLTRETADHSLPYVLVAAFHDGEVTVGTFDERQRARLIGSPVLPVVEVAVDDEIERAFPHDLGLHITVTRTDATQWSAEFVNPAGHHRNPLDEPARREKFVRITGGELGDAETAEELYGQLSRLVDVPDVAELLSRLDISAGTPGA